MQYALGILMAQFGQVVARLNLGITLIAHEAIPGDIAIRLAMRACEASHFFFSFRISMIPYFTPSQVRDIAPLSL